MSIHHEITVQSCVTHAPSTINQGSLQESMKRGVTEFGLRVSGKEGFIPLVEPQFTIGSGAPNDLVLSDRYVSKQHCVIERRRRGLRIRDQGSRNGTWINSVLVQDADLPVPAQLRVGRTTLHIETFTTECDPWGIVGHHASMQEVFTHIRRFGPSGRSVLILGETGTGKELIARALHTESDRREKPFEALNCSAIPHELAESELFGHEKGAFTGATRTHLGAFQRAQGGTLFLDEIGEMPIELQPKLLRVLEEGVVRPVGSAHAKKMDVRVIAATHRHPEQAVQAGTFRLDLLHRLAVGVIHVPSLRSRVSDIPLLVEKFLQSEAPQGKRFSLAKEVMPYLMSLPWTGNVRALRNAVQRAVTAPGPVLILDDFRAEFFNTAPRAHEGYVKYSGKRYDEIRREIYLGTIQLCGGNRSRASMMLGIPKSTFFDQLKTMGL